MRKQYILYIVIAILSLTNILSINNVSALSYSSNVGVGFTFNPTLSISLSSSDLVISNLVPGSTLDSNAINVSVASNAAYGYTLSAIVNGNNNDLVHTNGTNIFSSIATNANLTSLEDSEDNNIWGYSYKNNTVVSPAWSNYNGLSNSSNAILLDNSNAADSTGSVDFKISAKASSTQPSGEYTGTINFVVVSKVAPMSLLDSFIASGAEQLNGYFKMQDMTHDICENVDIEESELQLIDVRDNKIYWVAKLKDDNCWMTQNLDLDLSHEIALTSETSDIDPESYGKTIYTQETGYSKDETTGVVSWLPSTIDENGMQRADTIVMNGNSVPNWANNYNNPYSADPGERYRYTNPSSYSENTYASLVTCVNNNNNDTIGCQHSHFGNYYNWPAAIATNDASTAQDRSTQSNSICPKNWDLPANGKYATLMTVQEVFKSYTSYATGGFDKLRTSPLYFQLFGIINSGSLGSLGSKGAYWSSTVSNSTISHDLDFSGTGIWPSNGTPNYGTRSFGISVRCIAK